MTSYTVTGTATNNTFTGGMLKVYVLDNASIAGTPAVGSSTTAYNCSVTPSQNNSFFYGIAANEIASTAFTAEANTTISDQGSVSGGGAQAAAYHTTAGSSSPGTPITIGSTTTFAGDYGTVAMEILASGGTQSIDGSSPAAIISTTLTSFTTASFAPPGGNILVAVLCANGNGSANVCVGTVSSTPSLTWTEQIKVNSTVDATNSYIGVWTATAPANSAVPVLPPRWMQRVAVVPFNVDVIM